MNDSMSQDAASPAITGSVRPRNPLALDPNVVRHSSYLGIGPSGLTRLRNPDLPPSPDETRAHTMLVDKILGDGFPCVAARSAFNRRGYRFGLYPQMATAQSASAVCHDLYEFTSEPDQPDDRFATFIAVFQTPSIDTELHFEQLLWQQLQLMHHEDAKHFAWNESVSSDPQSARFAFSIAARAFFVVGLHAQASRRARGAAWPMIAFNLHEQFERLKSRGKYDMLSRSIRSRDLAYQGSVNPMLSNFGDKSEALQYSGRAVGEDWQCPFHANVQQ